MSTLYHSDLAKNEVGAHKMRFPAGLGMPRDLTHQNPGQVDKLMDGWMDFFFSQDDLTDIKPSP